MRLDMKMANMYWNDLFDLYERQYQGKLIRKVTDMDDSFQMSLVRANKKNYLCEVHIGLSKYADQSEIDFVDFVWETHKILHEFGHVNQRMNLYQDQEAPSDVKLMAKQQVICIEFPFYNRDSYPCQLCEVDAERYSWINTVSFLSRYFPEECVKQNLVNGLKKYFFQPWFANKFFDTWKEGLCHLCSAFEEAKTKTWSIEEEGSLPSARMPKKLLSDKRRYREMMGLYGKDRNEYLFQYCVLHSKFDKRKFPCIVNEVKEIQHNRFKFWR